MPTTDDTVSGPERMTNWGVILRSAARSRPLHLALLGEAYKKHMRQTEAVLRGRFHESKEARRLARMHGADPVAADMIEEDAAMVDELKREQAFRNAQWPDGFDYENDYRTLFCAAENRGVPCGVELLGPSCEWVRDNMGRGRVGGKTTATKMVERLLPPSVGGTVRGRPCCEKCYAVLSKRAKVETTTHGGG